MRSADVPSAGGARTPRPPEPTPFAAARRLVLDGCEPLGTERVADYAGRVFAESLVCPFDVPLFDNSAVDGYAVRAGDAGPRRVVGESAAGGPPPPPVGPGEAVRIFTGAPIPDGTDAVAMQEDARREGALVRLDPMPARDENVRRKGEEIAAGAVFDVAGMWATPPLVGLVASFGLAELDVFRRPRVVIVATGSELKAPGQPLGPGGVYASNPAALAAALRLMGLSEVETRLVGDDPAATERTLAEALEGSDVLLTVGGVSVGDHDLVRPTLARLGVEERLWRVAMRPGKPFLFGTQGAKRVFGLPGNPVSALVTFALLVRPALRRMIGLRDAEEEAAARLGAAIVRDDRRYEFARATLKDGTATPVLAQGSHMQTGLAFADALIHVPESVTSLDKGEVVTVTRLTWGY